MVTITIHDDEADSATTQDVVYHVIPVLPNGLTPVVPTVETVVPVVPVNTEDVSQSGVVGA